MLRLNIGHLVLFLFEFESLLHLFDLHPIWQEANEKHWEATAENLHDVKFPEITETFLSHSKKGVDVVAEHFCRKQIAEVHETCEHRKHA